MHGKCRPKGLGLRIGLGRNFLGGQYKLFIGMPLKHSVGACHTDSLAIANGAVFPVDSAHHADYRLRHIDNNIQQIGILERENRLLGLHLLKVLHLTLRNTAAKR